MQVTQAAYMAHDRLGRRWITQWQTGQEKKIGVALRKCAGLVCGMPAKKFDPHWFSESVEIVSTEIQVSRDWTTHYSPVVCSFMIVIRLETPLKKYKSFWKLKSFFI